MKLNEYLTENGVKLMIKGSGENYPPRQTNDLGMYDYAEGLENVIGKMAWICDYRANADPTKKPIRNIKPTPVVVTDAKETSKTIYYSPVYFRPVNRGKISSTVIAPLDNTGYRCCSGTSVNIFYTKEKCVKCYREQVRQANEIYEKEKAHYEWRSNDCPYDYSGELYEDGKVSLEQTVSEFLESEYTGASRATYVSHYGLSYNTYGDSLSDDTLEIGCSIMTDGIKDFVQRNAGIPCERFSCEEFFDIKTECNEFDPIYDECRASDFFWATAAVEFAGIDKMTLKEVLAAV